MKLKLLIFIIFSLVIALTFAGCNTEDSSINTTTDAPSSPSATKASPSPSETITTDTPSVTQGTSSPTIDIDKNDPKVKEALQHYKDVIQNKTKLKQMSYEGNYDEGTIYSSFLLSDLFKNVDFIDENANPYFSKFTVLDMDGDNVPEIVLSIDSYGSGYFEILHYHEGTAYGYMFVDRSMLNLKTDGTYIASSGASNNYTNKLSFSGSTLKEITLAYSEMTSEDIKYYISDKPVSEEEYIEYNSQNKTSEAPWYSFNDENIEKYLQ